MNICIILTVCTSSLCCIYSVYVRPDRHLSIHTLLDSNFLHAGLRAMWFICPSQHYIPTTSLQSQGAEPSFKHVSKSLIIFPTPICDEFSSRTSYNDLGYPVGISDYRRISSSSESAPRSSSRPAANQVEPKEVQSNFRTDRPIDVLDIFCRWCCCRECYRGLHSCWVIQGRTLDDVNVSRASSCFSLIGELCRADPL